MGQKKNYTLFDTYAYEKEAPDYNVDKMAESGGHPTHSPPLSLFLVSYLPTPLAPRPRHARVPQVSDAALHSGRTPIQPPGFKYYPRAHDVHACL